MGIPLSEVADHLVRLAPHMQIAHHIPGRIRLKILHSGIAIARENDIQDLVLSVPGIRNIRLNPLNRSVVIEYDAARFPSDLWENMLHLARRPEHLTEIHNRLQRLGD